MSLPLDRVVDQLVTEHNPPDYDVNGMDTDRCVLLHNAILEHGWIASGRSAQDFEANTRTWWSEYGGSAEEGRLHPSLRAFLARARVVPYGYQPDTSFFFNVRGLNPSVRFWDGPASSVFEDENMILTLYSSHEKLAGIPDGMLYDQVNHNAIMHFDIEDDVPTELEKWDKLESILTVWIEMIRRQKIVALPANVGRVEYEPAPEGGFRLIPAPERDPTTGARRIYEELSPWTAQPWTAQDLEDALQTWQMALDAIEDKMGLTTVESPIIGIYDEPTLDSARIPDGFARDFLLKARRPRFQFIAPGLRVSSMQEFVDQPLIQVHANLTDTNFAGEVPPILLFRNDAQVSSSDLGFLYPYSGSQALVTHCQAGLWLERCDRMHQMPFEDGFRLVLPTTFGAEHARQSDLTAVETHDGLLQIGMNPYNDRHSPQLQAFLETILSNVRTGAWPVNEHGVSGGIDVWENADTEAHWLEYFVRVGPGRFW